MKRKDRGRLRMWFSSLKDGLGFPDPFFGSPTSLFLPQHTHTYTHTARTNIKYVVNQFRFKKAMERAVLLAFEKDGVDPAKLDEAAEVCSYRGRKRVERGLVGRSPWPDALLLLLTTGDAHLPFSLPPFTRSYQTAQLTAVVDNEMTQLDSSVYTQIFIPSEGELNPAAFKYRDQVSAQACGGFRETAVLVCHGMVCTCVCTGRKSSLRVV